MREIKFRGKSFDKGWIYGNLIKSEQSAWIRESDYYNFKVKPETIGQYTGLKDKNGKEIYEGDIVKLHYIKNGLAEIKAEVAYSEEYAQYIIKNTTYVTDDYEPLSDYEDLEVIGNIYENSELLEA